MIPNILQLLTAAIREKRCVAIRYHDQRHVRVIEPHVIFAHESGELLVDAYQTRGYSESGRLPPFWRPFRLKKISAVSLLKETFETRLQEGFSPDKIKYQRKRVAMIDERRPGGEKSGEKSIDALIPPASRTRRSQYTYSQPEDIGPHLPKNPYRR